MKIAVLLSGGVDSSLALHLLAQEKNVQLTAFYLKIWLEDELAFLGDCPWEEDLKYARAVCAQAGVPLKIVPLQTQYHQLIVEHALAELRAGRTPSPDIFCNQRIKFGEFFTCIDSSYAKVASGHYARLEERGGLFLLRRSPDPVKDQTYFLSNLGQSQLSRLLFPIGHLTKGEVRQLAGQFELPTKDRPDSQGLCFLGKIDYRHFVKFHLGEKKGPIVELETGEEKGEQPGYWFYTIGQRHGLGLGGGPWYVVGKDVEKNLVYISHHERLDQFARNSLIAEKVNWIAGLPAKDDLQVKLRHGPALCACRVEFLAADRVRVNLADPDPGIAPGQHAVFYDGDFCLGGGVIATSAAPPANRGASP